MGNLPFYSWARRLLFPYSGREPLSRAQGLRVILIWALFFAFVLTFCSFPVMLLAGPFTLHRIVLLLLTAYLSGVLVFGSLAWLVVAMSNRAARLLQQRQRVRSGNTSGGRYGS